MYIPLFDTVSRKMSGYQLPVAMEVIRGRFRKSFEKPSPLVPTKPEEFVIDLHDINHTFLKGHQYDDTGTKHMVPDY